MNTTSKKSDTVTTSAPAGLWAKIAAVQAEAGRIPKNGWNDFNKYKYVLEADMVDFLRPRLAERGLVVSFSCDPNLTSFHSRKNQKGNEEFMVVAHLVMRITDSATGEFETFCLPCAGADQGDKGVYKAITGGKKYLLQTNFNIATGDDPETMEKPTGGAAARRKAGSADAPAPTREGEGAISKRDRFFRRIFAIKGDLGWDDAGLDRYVLNTFGKTSKGLLTDEEVEQLGYQLSGLLKEMDSAGSASGEL
jgi:hypothetical protein